MQTEAWLSGPLSDVPRLLMPAAHALAQSRSDLERHAANLTAEEVWSEPGGAPSVGFHLRHIAGSIDRLLTYTAGRQLTAEQFRELAGEGVPGEPPPMAAELLAAAAAQIGRALEVIGGTRDEDLFDGRGVGRARLPTNVFGLLFHIAEHTQRHVGQIIATATVVRGRR